MSENMVSVRNAKAGFFPLDKELGLVEGGLSPRLSEWTALLGASLPFEQARKLLDKFSGVSISKQTVRRHTERTGQALVQSQSATVEQLYTQPPEPVAQPKRLVVSVDGAMVPLLHGEWSEVKTIAIGVLNEKKKSKGEPLVTEISYHSRLSNSENFEKSATLETHKRGVTVAPAVASVSDGAEWINGFVDLHRHDAERINDFIHTSQYVHKIGEIVYGKELPADWLSERLHKLKHEGPTQLFDELETLVKMVDQEIPELQQALNYLRKREERMQYPKYQAEGWPIGSGMIESANKLVVEARLKGAGMHWLRTNVDPMLSLRNSIANGEWEEGWSERVKYRQEQIKGSCLERAQEHVRLKGEKAVQKQSEVSVAEGNQPIVVCLETAETQIGQISEQSEIPAKSIEAKKLPKSTYSWRQPFLRRFLPSQNSLN